MSDPSRLGKRSRRKGKAQEKEIASTIAEWLGIDAADVTGSRSGKTEADIQLSAHAKRVFPFHVEAKNQKALKIHEWLRQANADAKASGLEPVVVFKEHGNSQQYAIIRFETFMELVTRHLNAPVTEDEV